MCCHVNLVHLAVSSSIVTHPTDTSAAAPYSAAFICSIYGYGYQNVTWHRESSKLPYDHQIREIPSPRIITTILTISNVTEQDAGKYYCQVWANNMRAQSDRANLYYAGNIDIFHYMHYIDKVNDFLGQLNVINKYIRLLMML